MVVTTTIYRVRDPGQGEPPEPGAADEGDADFLASTHGLVDAAVEVFGELGIEAGSLFDVAQRAGSPAEDVEKCWEGKHELFEAAFESVVAQRMSLLIKAAPVPAAEKLTMMGANLLSSERNTPRDLWIEALALALRDDDWRPKVSAALDAEASDIAEIIEEGKSAGDIDSALSTRAIVLLCHSLGIGSHLLLRARQGRLSEEASAGWHGLVERLIEGLRPPPPEEF